MVKTILALDCSLRWTNVAVFAGGGVLISKQLDLGRRQAAELPAVTEDALSGAGLAFGQIDLLAVTNGPGYFTGVRIGASYVLALAYALGLKIAPAPTLRMLTDSARGQAGVGASLFLTVVYAGRERVYAASFGRVEAGSEELPAGEYGKDRIEAWLLANGHAQIVSDAPEKTFLPSLKLPARQGQNFISARPDAAQVARFAWENPQAAVNPKEFKVAYHRSPLQ